MLRSRSLLAGMILVLGAGTKSRCQAAEPTAEVKIGLLHGMFKDVTPSLIKAGAIPLQKMLQEKTGLVGKVELVQDYKTLAEKMKEGKIDIAVFHGFEYAWVKDHPDLVPLVITQPNCGKVQACLVVNKDSKAASPKDLKGACIAVPKGSKAHCEVFLQRLRDGVPVGDCCPLKPSGDITPEEALCAVAGGESEAALVDVSSLLALKNNLPAAANRLKILVQTPELPSAVIVYRKGCMNAETVQLARKALIDCANTPTAALFRMFWQLKGFGDVSPAYNNLLAESLKALPKPGAKPSSEPITTGMK